MRGYVYFITMEPDQFVKIGFTSGSPASRMGTLQTGCPEALHLRAVFPGTLDDENRLHQVFAPLRYRGEWFVNERKLRDFLGYFDGYRDKVAPRELFESALHDCVMQSCWWPGCPIDQDEYDSSATWRPFHKLLWDVFGPWGDDE